MSDADEEAREEAEFDGFVRDVFIVLVPWAERLNRDGLRHQAERATRVACIEVLLLSPEFQRFLVDQIDKVGHVAHQTGVQDLILVGKEVDRFVLAIH